jgi:carbon monoxide dehydrogenase subunit G
LELRGQRRLPIARGAAWAALNDPAILAACIPGCESIEKTGDGEYAVALTAHVGPVSAKFRGKLRLEDVVAPERYTLRFDGEGGTAGFAKGSAQVTLAEQDGHTLLAYSVRAQIGGRIAQVGNRLVDSVALKHADQFFTAFEKKVSGAVSAHRASDAAAAERVPPLHYAMVVFILAALVASVAYTLR